MSDASTNHFLVNALGRSAEPLVRLNLTPGEHVFRQNDKVHSIFVVERGRIRLDRCLPDGTTVSLYSAEAGDSFAEAALSSDRYHCNAVAAVPSIVLFLPAGLLRERFSTDAASAMELAMFFSRQVRDVRARLELRNVRPASSRLITWLKSHSTGDPPRHEVARTWSEVANELGLTREALYRTLSKLERNGAVTRHKGLVYLNRPIIGDEA